MRPTNPFGDPNLVNAKYATIGQPGDDPVYILEKKTAGLEENN